MTLKVSLIITTYNWPDALECVFETIREQSYKPTEIIVADDGSSPATQVLIDKAKESLPVIHVWQPDSSFRAARARNLALLKATNPYIVLIDGDCLIPSEFVKSHCELSKEKKLVAGGRHLLSDRQTQHHLNNTIDISSAFKSLKFTRLRIPLSLRDFIQTNWGIARTCNLSFFRRDALTIGGFDESFVGWGKEDSDFVVRFQHAGFKIRNGRFGATVSHLNHKISDRSYLQINDSKLQDDIRTQNSFSKRTIFEEL